MECFKYLCIEAYADKLSRAGDGMTTLHGATQGGHFDTIKVCLFVCLFVNLFDFLFVCLYFCLFVCLLVYLFIYVSV